MVFFRMFNNNHKNIIISVQEVSLKIMGMRGSNLYKVNNTGGEIVIERYKERYRNDSFRYEPDKSISCSMEKIVDIMNACNIMRWDGFFGKHPKNVSDGDMFNFTAIVNEGLTIRAEGSANFPKGYHEFIRTLNEMLAD